MNKLICRIGKFENEREDEIALNGSYFVWFNTSKMKKKGYLGLSTQDLMGIAIRSNLQFLHDFVYVFHGSVLYVGNSPAFVFFLEKDAKVFAETVTSFYNIIWEKADFKKVDDMIKELE
jgi:hypothetical protein